MLFQNLTIVFVNLIKIKIIFLKKRKRVLCFSFFYSFQFFCNLLVKAVPADIRSVSCFHSLRKKYHALGLHCNGSCLWHQHWQIIPDQSHQRQFQQNILFSSKADSYSQGYRIEHKYISCDTDLVINGCFQILKPHNL